MKKIPINPIADKEKPISKVYPEIDTDLARDNIQTVEKASDARKRHCNLAFVAVAVALTTQMRLYRQSD